MMKILSKLIALLILLFALFIIANIVRDKGPKDWSKASVEKWLSQILDKSNEQGGGGNSAQQPTPVNTFSNNVNQDLKPTPTAAEEKQSVVMYQWKDDAGRLQFGQSPPADRPFKKMNYQVKKGVEPVNSGLANNGNSAQYQFPKKQQKLPVNQNSASRQSIESKVSTECRWDVKRLLGYERKLSKEKNIVGNIWLQDYCDVLSSLVTNNCQLSKKDVKYNAYCPVRFRR